MAPIKHRSAFAVYQGEQQKPNKVTQITPAGRKDDTGKPFTSHTKSEPSKLILKDKEVKKINNVTTSPKEGQPVRLNVSRKAKKKMENSFDRNDNSDNETIGKSVNSCTLDDAEHVSEHVDPLPTLKKASKRKRGATEFPGAKSNIPAPKYIGNKENTLGIMCVSENSLNEPPSKRKSNKLESNLSVKADEELLNSTDSSDSAELEDTISSKRLASKKASKKQRHETNKLTKTRLDVSDRAAHSNIKNAVINGTNTVLGSKISPDKLALKRKPRKRKQKLKDNRPSVSEPKLAEVGQKMGYFPVRAKNLVKLNSSSGKCSLSVDTKGKKHEKNQALKTVECVQKKEKNSNNVVVITPRQSVPCNEVTDSFADGEKTFGWMICPLMPQDFFESAWEKEPILLKRKDPSYYRKLLSTKEIDIMLRENNIQYTKNLDLTSYTNGVRETHNPVGRAYPAVVWDYYSNGCSVRLLNPQTYIHPIWQLCTTLQDYFGCFVGTNSYLTPPGTQGFAPHYDDIEAFILQVEGRKHWKVYKPRSAEETLPQFSSGNFSQNEIGDLILDEVLEPGDMLYFPRGFVHQGSTPADSHSLHITVSCYQKNSWGDLLEKVLPAALKAAVEDDIEFRKGLPLDYLRCLGSVYSDQQSPRRKLVMKHVEKLMDRLFQYAPIDAAADQMGKDFIHSALPPVLTKGELSRTVYGDGEKMSNGVVTDRVEMGPEVHIKLLRGNIIRMVAEDGSIRIYHCAENSREYKADDPQFIEIPDEMAPAVEFLIQRYPAYTLVQDLPLDDFTNKVQIAGDLWERGLVITREPLEVVDD